MDTTTSAGTDGVLITVVGLLGLCIFGLGIAGAVFFVYYRFAGGNVVDFFADLLRGDKDEEKDKVAPVPPPPQLRDLANQASFDQTLTQHMLNNEVKTGSAINSQYVAPYPPSPTATGSYPAQNAPYPPPATATGTYPAQNAPYPPPANRPNTGYPPPNMGYPPPASASRAAGQPPPSPYPPGISPTSGYPSPAAHSGYPASPPASTLPPAAPKRDPFGSVGVPDTGSGGLSAPQSAEYNRNQGYMPNPGEGDDFLGGLDEDIGI
jgi:hypothetical protein